MTDEELIREIRNNPQEGVGKLIDLYGGAVTTICRNFLYDFSEFDIEEAVSDTFILFWKNIDKFKLNQEFSLKSYIYSIARNTARDKRRKEKKIDIFSMEEISLDIPDSTDIEREYEYKQKEKILHTCIRQMKEPERTVFLYRFFYGYKISDIANILSLDKKKIENILYRGKKKLREKLNERRDFFDSYR